MIHTLLSYKLYLYQMIAMLAFFSFLGWIIECVYRSLNNRRFVNPGYLFGPFVPIYGIGAVFIIIAGFFLRNYPVWTQLAGFALLTTTLELLTGFIAIQLFGYTLWNYSDNRFNFKGIICLKYSVIWALLSWIFFYTIFPMTYIAIDAIGSYHIKLSALLFAGYFLIDLFVSTLQMLDFARRIGKLYNEFSTISTHEILKIPDRFSRLFEAFPGLNKLLERVLHDRIGGKLHSLFHTFSLRRTAKNISSKKEYMDIVKDIIEHKEFIKLKNYYHHNSSIFEHVQAVSYLSYRIAKALKLDYQSTARGSLLHDFFLYDWRNHKEPDLAEDKFHGIHHPRIAYENANKYFTLNHIEKDIILKHMWPLTIIPPKFKESYIVTFVDKLMSSKEYTSRIKTSASKDEISAERKVPHKISKRIDHYIKSK